MSQSVKQQIENLKTYLQNSDAVKNASKVEDLLAPIWTEFTGSELGGMMAYKLHGRMEQIEWNPPMLSFKVERHGGTVQGSSRAELQNWEINLDALTAEYSSGGHRKLTPTAPKVDVKPIAKEIAEAILAGEKKAYLNWKLNEQVRVQFSKFFPSNSGVKQTVQERRQRCRLELEKIVSTRGWYHSGLNVFKKKKNS